MLRDYFSLAVESLRVRQVRTWLTMIGIFIGIAAIVSLISLGQGMKEAITSQFAALGSDKITIQARGLTLGPPGSNVVEPLSKSDLEAVKKVPGVNRAGGRMIKAVNVLFKEQRSFVFMAASPLVAALSRSQPLLEVVPVVCDACSLSGRRLQLSHRRTLRRRMARR